MIRIEEAAGFGFLTVATAFAEALGTTPYGFLTALAGTLAAVVALPAQPIEWAPSDKRRGVLARIASLTAFFFAWALVAAWVADLLMTQIPFLDGAPELAVHGLCGLAVRPLLPRVLRVAERRADRLGD